MTTSATLPSTTGPVAHGGFSTMAEDAIATNDGGTFEAPRPPKRGRTSLPHSSKKRRKQSTPVRISASDSEFATPSEGKTTTPSPSPEPLFRCPLCQQPFDKIDRLEAHLMTEHGSIQCKNELVDDIPAPNAALPATFEHPFEMLPTSRNELTWISDLQGKEWMNPSLNGLPFSSATSLFMSLPHFPQSETMNQQQVRIFNPDAFCDLCNKEFCNKYFLKTHKANKHGVYMDPLLPDPFAYTAAQKVTAAKQDAPPSSAIKSDNARLSAANPFSDIFSTNSNPCSNKMFSKIAKPNIQGLLESETSESATADLSVSSMPCNGQNERNSSEDALPVHTPLSSPKTIPADYPPIKSEFNFEQETNFHLTKMSPSQIVRDLDPVRLRRLGVMNPKAFCEFCCKEYCNKYFLRTHKEKRHGIFVTDEPKDKENKSTESAGNATWSRNMQTSPLNLIMTEQTSSSSSGRKTSSPADICCDTCGIKFQNAGLAQLHNVSVHSKIAQEQVDHDVDELNRSSAELIGVNEKTINSSDTISEDLQKLQTMILQLNDLDVSRVNNIVCNVCNKEFENRYYLHAHMMSEHGLLVEEPSEGDKPMDSDATQISTHFTCELCNKEGMNADEMKQHLTEVHPDQLNNDSKEEYLSSPDKSTNRSNTSNSQYPERRTSSTVIPNSSYCDICNKELCNKYFMKTHMQRMHGIEIEHGAQISGVICDVCNKELCSKYFLRVHKHNSHGIVEYGSTLLQPRNKSDGEAPTMLPTESDPALKPGDLADLSHRYFTHFTEVCSICSRRFRSTKWLKAHLLGDHGQAGAEKWAELEQHLQQSMGQNVKSTGNFAKNPPSGENSPALKIPNGSHDNSVQKVNIQNVLSSIFGADETIPKNYHCSYCSFQTPVLPFLFVHERSHSLPHATDNDNVQLKCPVCSQNFPQTELLQHHLFTQHPFFPLPPFFNGNAEVSTDSRREAGEIIIDGDDFKHDGSGSISPLDAINKQQQHQQQSMPQLAQTNQLTPPPHAQSLPLQPPPPPPSQPSQTSQPSQPSQPPPPPCKSRRSRRKSSKSVELSPDVGQSLKDVAKRSQLPATYALPQLTEHQPSLPGYNMQAFLLDQEPGGERRFVPSVVFLPVLQKQLAPLTVTFTLTPA